MKYNTTFEKFVCLFYNLCIKSFWVIGYLPITGIMIFIVDRVLITHSAITVIRIIHHIEFIIFSLIFSIWFPCWIINSLFLESLFASDPTKNLRSVSRTLKWQSDSIIWISKGKIYQMPFSINRSGIQTKWLWWWESNRSVKKWNYFFTGKKYLIRLEYFLESTISFLIKVGIVWGSLCEKWTNTRLINHIPNNTIIGSNGRWDSDEIPRMIKSSTTRIPMIDGSINLIHSERITCNLPLGSRNRISTDTRIAIDDYFGSKLKFFWNLEKNWVRKGIWIEL